MVLLPSLLPQIPDFWGGPDGEGDADSMEGSWQEVANTLLSWGSLLREAESGSFPLWLGHLAFCSS